MIAIVIPFFKLAFFEETIKSLANQTDKRFKVFIGDDASPEDCTPLLKAYENQFDFKYHRFATNMGGSSLTKQWERCLDLIDDENIKWVMILGDDDVLTENVIAAFYENYIEFDGKANVIRYASQKINETNLKISQIFIHPKFESGVNFFLRKLSGKTRSSLSEYIFLKKVYEKYRFTNYPLGWHSDDKAWIDFSRLSSIYSINDVIINIRISDLNISNNNYNAEVKLQSTKSFLFDIINDKSLKFSNIENNILLNKLEFEIKRSRPLYVREWVFLGKQYLIKTNFMSIIKFFRRFFITFFYG